MIDGNEFLSKNPQVKNLVNINEKDKLVVWLFPKTATRLFCTLMLNCDFECYSYENENRKLIEKDLIHHHNFYLFSEIQNYKMIVTARNPYSLLVSNYYMFNKVEDLSKLKSSFRDFLELSLFKNPWFNEFLYGLNYVKVSYKIRVENLEEDYYNLPIISKSISFRNNKLIESINSKVHKSKNPLSNLDYKLFYDRNSADLVYYNFSKYFEIFGYDKNSWKK